MTNVLECRPALGLTTEQLNARMALPSPSATSTQEVGTLPMTTAASARGHSHHITKWAPAYSGRTSSIF